MFQVRDTLIAVVKIDEGGRYMMIISKSSGNSSTDHTAELLPSLAIVLQSFADAETVIDE